MGFSIFTAYRWLLEEIRSGLITPRIIHGFHSAPSPYRVISYGTYFAVFIAEVCNEEVGPAETSPGYTAAPLINPAK